MGQLGRIGYLTLVGDFLGVDRSGGIESCGRNHNRRPVDCGRRYNLMKDNRLGGLKNWGGDEGRFRRGRNDGLIGYNRLRGAKNEGRGDKTGGFGDHGRSSDLMRCNHLREFKNGGRSNKMGRFGDHGRSSDLTRCNHLREFKNGGRSNKMGRFGDRGRSSDLTRRNHLREFKNWGRNGDRGRVREHLRNDDSVFVGLDGFERCEYLLGRNELGYLWRYGVFVATAGRLRRRGRWLAIDR